MPSVAEILGTYTGTFVGYATKTADRDGAASGGVTSAINRYLLESGIVDGVLASRHAIVDGQIIPETVIARTVEELKGCRNSIYVDFNLGASGRYKSLIDELQSTGHRIAVVGLYCHLSNLANMLERRGVKRERVLMIGLFCSSSPERTLLKQVIERQGVDLAHAVSYQPKGGDGGRNGRIFDRSRVTMSDGSVKTFPLIHFRTFKAAYFNTPKKCLACPDQFSEIADISCGDAWYSSIRKHQLKQTTVVARTNEARDIIMRMVRAGRLELRAVDSASVVYSQKRVAGVEKAALSARIRLAPWFGIRLPQVAENKPRIRDYVHSFLILSGIKASESPSVMKVIMALPTWVILPYTLMIKLIEQTLLSGLPKGSGVGAVITGYEDDDAKIGAAANKVNSARPQGLA